MLSFPIAPVQASDFAVHYDALFYTILALTILFTVGTGFFIIFFALRYRRGAKVNRENAPHENMPLEITWSVIPLILGLGIFAWGAKLFVDFKTPPKDASEIYVVGKQWMWHFQHADSGIRENNMIHLPVGVPVKFTMISQDVIHALYIPEFRIQYQVLPGRYTQMWCTPTRVGKYHLFCNMYCGTQHSEMGGYVYVMNPKDYAAWAANGGNDPEPMSPTERGQLLFKRYVCTSCHGPQDTIHGPSLYGLYGKTVGFTDGTKLVADDDYIRNSILNPYDKIVEGYSNTMPVYKGEVTESDLFDMVAYIHSLGLAKGPSNTSESPEMGIQPSTKGGARLHLSVGALAHEAPATPGPHTGKEAVGALSTQYGN